MTGHRTTIITSHKSGVKPAQRTKKGHRTTLMVKLPTPSMWHSQHSQRVGEPCTHGHELKPVTRIHITGQNIPGHKGSIHKGHHSHRDSDLCAYGSHWSGSFALISGMHSQGVYFCTGLIAPFGSQSSGYEPYQLVLPATTRNYMICGQIAYTYSYSVPLHLNGLPVFFVPSHPYYG